MRTVRPGTCSNATGERSLSRASQKGAHQVGPYGGRCSGEERLFRIFSALMGGVPAARGKGVQGLACTWLLEYRVLTSQ